MSQISKGKVALQGSGLRRRYPVLPSSGQASTIPAGCDRPISAAGVHIDAHSALIRDRRLRRLDWW